ncbi:GNAT family N-acetyltransferase [Kordia sp. YSTF-M3]|uniref:GNAT family N-acetyltransferase n=1 Tax=Kordia aestuariivivens TaxID=2759037 RepID=A0ABR7Q5K7_9FLAO|nr:GNAT family N-acetyltransferase [Kordia aestuariivivens]
MTIRKATIEDCELIATIGKTTFLETYLVNTPKAAVEAFIEKAFAMDTLTKELRNPAIHYYIIYHSTKVAGYSKIELNIPNQNIDAAQITKLDRFYVLKEFHGQNVGAQLFNHTIVASKKLQQHGIWLYVWIENKRAINFYTKNNFKVVGYYDFVLSETRSNPNDVLYLEY